MEALSRAIVEGAAAAAAKVLFLIKPNGTTKAKTLSKSPNGAIRSGNAEDVSVLQMDKFADFRTARETMDRIEARLSAAFLINASVQRDAERVTAEEIRFMAQELDAGLGGVFSLLTQELQLPYVTRRMFRLQREGKLPRLPKGIVRVSIITGIEALGRSQDGNKLIAFISTLAKTIGPEETNRRVNLTEFVDRLAVSEGIDTENLIRSDAEVQASADQDQQRALLAKVAPEVVKQGGALATQQPQQQGTNDG